VPVKSSRPLRICLYVAIPEQEQFRKVQRPLSQRVKSTIRNLLNDLVTRLTGQLQLDVYHYWTAANLGDNSNRGDIAIRMSVREQLIAAFAPRPVTFTELAWGALSEKSVAEINATSDLFVIGGGGYIFISADGSAGDMLAADSPYLNTLNCPIIAVGIGLNRLMHEEVRSLETLPAKTRELIKALSTACESVSVRDRDTLELFDLHGDKSAALTGDPVLFLNNPGDGTGKPPGRSLSVGLNLAAHGWRAIAMLLPLLPEIVDFLKAIQTRHGVEFVYLLHHDFERPVTKFLRRQGIRMRVVDSEPTELLKAYDHVDIVICQMLHACIFAANAEVPFLNIAYDQKNIAFCNLLEIADSCIPYTRAKSAALQQKFEDLLRNRASLVKTISERKASLRQEYARFLQQVAAAAPSE